MNNIHATAGEKWREVSEMDPETREMLIIIKRCIREIDDAVIPKKDTFVRMKNTMDALIAHLPYDSEIGYVYESFKAGFPGDKCFPWGIDVEAE